MRLTRCFRKKQRRDSRHRSRRFEQLVHLRKRSKERTMRIAKLSGAMFSIAIIAGALGYQFNHQSHTLLMASDVAINEVADKKHPPPNALQRYALDAWQSKFIAHALAGGLLWFKGHDHLVAVRDFTGGGRLDPDFITPFLLLSIAQCGDSVETPS